MDIADEAVALRLVSLWISDYFAVPVPTQHAANYHQTQR